MDSPNIAIIYFSATGNTEKIAKVMYDFFIAKNCSIELFNITPYRNRQKKFTFSNYDVVIFGFPVYGSAIPRICLDWLVTIKGKNNYSAMFFTYGGPTMGIAHYHTESVLKKRDFQVIASAEFPSKHSYNVTKGFNFLANRPNEDDYNVAREYAQKLLEKYNKGNLSRISFEKPEITDIILERITKQKKRINQYPPTRDGKDCNMCRNCEDNCPTNAFDANLGISDGKKCIACMYCVTNCPDKVIVYKRDMTNIYKRLKEHFNLTEEAQNNLRSKYYLS